MNHTEAHVPFTVTAIFGADTRRPFVQLQIDGHEWLVDPAEARTVAGFLQEAAAAAEYDAATVELLSAHGFSVRACAVVLRELRARRPRPGTAGQAP